MESYPEPSGVKRMPLAGATIRPLWFLQFKAERDPLVVPWATVLELGNTIMNKPSENISLNITFMCERGLMNSVGYQKSKGQSKICCQIFDQPLVLNSNLNLIIENVTFASSAKYLNTYFQ